MNRHLSAIFIEASNKNELIEKLETLFDKIKFQRYINRMTSKAIKCVKKEIIEGSIKKVDGLYYFDKYIEDILNGNYFYNEEINNDSDNPKLDKLCKFFYINVDDIRKLYEDTKNIKDVIDAIYSYSLQKTIFVILINHDIPRHGTYDFECITDSKYANLRDSFNYIIRNIEEDKYDWLFTCNNFYTYTYDNPENDNLHEMDIIYTDYEED